MAHKSRPEARIERLKYGTISLWCCSFIHLTVLQMKNSGVSVSRGAFSIVAFRLGRK